MAIEGARKMELYGAVAEGDYIKILGRDQDFEGTVTYIPKDLFHKMVDSYYNKETE